MTGHVTYTYEALKEEIYKALDMYSANGELYSASSGVKADIEQRMLPAVTRALNSVALHFPLIEKTVTLAFSNSDSLGYYATLPADCYRILKVICNNEVRLDANRFGDSLYLAGVKSTDSVTVRYGALWVPASEDESYALEMLPASFDAFVYLACMELCPTENSDMYAKLLARYNALYEASYSGKDKYTGIQNNLFHTGGGRLWR